MRLVTAPQAARELYISTGLLHYWIRTGRLQKYPYPLAASTVKVRKKTVSHRRFMVDIDQVRLLRRADAEDQIKLLNSDKRLLRPQEVAKIVGVTVQRVYQWVARYELTKYKTGSDTCYLVDGDELADALEANGLGHLVK